MFQPFYDMCLLCYVNFLWKFIFSLFFHFFSNNLEKLIIDIYSQKASFLLMHGDFNAKLGNWLINNTKTPEGAQIDSVTSLYEMENLISKQTDILQQFSSCIDLFPQNNPILPWITMQIHVYVLNVTAGNLLKNQFKNWVSSFLHL